MSCWHLQWKAKLSSCSFLLLRIEVLIQELIDLADAEENEDLKYGVYSLSIRDSIQNLIGTRDIMKMRALSGTGKVGLEEHIKCIKDYRIRAQTMAQPEDIKRQVNLKKWSEQI